MNNIIDKKIDDLYNDLYKNNAIERLDYFFTNVASVKELSDSIEEAIYAMGSKRVAIVESETKEVKILKKFWYVLRRSTKGGRDE